jgi:hypothetical protein
VPTGSDRATAIGTSSGDESVGAGEGVAGGGGDAEELAVAVGPGVEVWSASSADEVGASVSAAVPLGLSARLSVGLALALELGVGDSSGVGDSRGVGDGPGTGREASDCGTGLDCTNQSALLSLVSTVLPLAPPGKRSRLDVAGGTGATVPST